MGVPLIFAVGVAEELLVLPRLRRPQSRCVCFQSADASPMAWFDAPSRCMLSFSLISVLTPCTSSSGLGLIAESASVGYCMSERGRQGGGASWLDVPVLPYSQSEPID